MPACTCHQGRQGRGKIQRAQESGYLCFCTRPGDKVCHVLPEDPQALPGTPCSIDASHSTIQPLGCAKSHLIYTAQEFILCSTVELRLSEQMLFAKEKDQHQLLPRLLSGPSYFLKEKNFGSQSQSTARYLPCMNQTKFNPQYPIGFPEHGQK